MTLKQLKHAYPRWHFWDGVAGLLYARRLMTSPPPVVRSMDAAGLGRKIAEQEMAYRDDHWG